MRFPVESLLSLYFLAAAFITIIFIDIKHLIIPSQITWSGTGTALVFSVALPYTIILPANHAFTKLNIDQQWLLNKLPMLESSPRLLALCYSLLGFAMGFGILWSVVELGKALFGKQKFKYDEPIDIVLSAEGAQSAGDELLPWKEVFDRKTDELTIDVEEGSWQVGQNEGVFEKHTLTIKHDAITIGDTSYTLSDIKNIQLKSKFFVVPREAMGRGDIKMLAMIGAFLGPAGVVCSLMLATFSGCLVGGLGIIIGKFTKSKQLPFGPYLAIGAAIWMLFWPDLIEIYLQSIDSLGDFLGGNQ
jgi:leader peptidase (prepilin peptidase)/N-methyltransferase